MSKVDFATLRQRQSLPLEAKVLFTKSRIRQWYDHWQGEVYVSFSGGKDSTVLLDLVRSLYPDVPAVFVDTGLEYPEVREFALAKADVVLKPELPFNQVVARYGYPYPTKEQATYIHQARHSTEHMRSIRLGDGRYAISDSHRKLLDAPFEVSPKCCDVMKKAPTFRYERETGRKRMTGMMACESSIRERMYLRYGCSSFDSKSPSSRPMAIWLEQDVLRYIKERELNFSSCYGEIVEGRDGALRCTREDRTGCMFCMFGVHLEKQPNRFQRMQRDYPMQWRFCMEQLGIREVLEYVGIPYEYQPTLFDLPTDEGGYK